MLKTHSPRPGAAIAGALTVGALLFTTACTSGGATNDPADAAPAASVNADAQALLPADIADRGTLRIAKK